MRHRLTGLVVFAVVVGLVSGCTSSSKTGSPPKTAGSNGSADATVTYSKPSGSVRGFDGTTIKVASLGIKAQLPLVEVGAKARIQRFNSTNEIPGVKIDYTEFADDNFDRATALSEGRRLVTDDKVFGIVGDVSSYNPGEYFTQQHVPYFGFAFDNTYCSATPSTSLWGFGIDGCLIPDDPKVLPDAAANIYKYISKATGKTHPTVALYSSDTPSGHNAAKFDEIEYNGAGFNVIFAKGIVPPPPVSDYTPYVQQVLHSNGGKAPDAIVCLLTTDCVAMYPLFQANKYPGVYMSSLYADVLLGALKGSAVFTVFAPLGDPTPANAQFASDLKAVDPSQKGDLGSAVGYLATDMFIQALKTVVNAKGKAYISPENVQQAAAHMSWEIKDMMGPTKYPESTVNPTPVCSAVVADNDGTQWTTAVPYSCSYKTFAVH